MRPAEDRPEGALSAAAKKVARFGVGGIGGLAGLGDVGQRGANDGQISSPSAGRTRQMPSLVCIATQSPMTSTAPSAPRSSRLPPAPAADIGARQRPQAEQTDGDVVGRPGGRRRGGDAVWVEPLGEQPRAGIGEQPGNRPVRAVGPADAGGGVALRQAGEPAPRFGQVVRAASSASSIRPAEAPGNRGEGAGGARCGAAPQAGGDAGGTEPGGRCSVGELSRSAAASNRRSAASRAARSPVPAARSRRAWSR